LKGKLLHEFEISDENFEKMFFNIFDKVNASFYHLEKLKENENIAIETGKELAKIKIPGTENMMGIAGSPYEPIGYEYETFLITIKSTLDFIAILLSLGFNRSEDNIAEFVKRMQSPNINLSPFERKILGVLNITKYASLINSFRNQGDQKSKRNYATHKGSLPIGTINIPINNPNASLLLSKALNPNASDPHVSIFSEQDLADFCEEQFYTTCDFLIEILNILTENRLIPGPKSSLYAERLNDKSY